MIRFFGLIFEDKHGHLYGYSGTIQTTMAGRQDR